MNFSDIFTLTMFIGMLGYGVGLLIRGLLTMHLHAGQFASRLQLNQRQNQSDILDSGKYLS